MVKEDSKTNSLFKILWVLSIIFSVTLIAGKAGGQTKYEREYRINEQDVPGTAIEYLNGFPFNRRIKWYINQYAFSETFEAKVRYQGRLYSIDFNQEGILNDLEVDIRQKEMPKEITSKIHHQLGLIFERYRILRIQAQFCTPDLHMKVSEGILKFLREANFEIIVEGNAGEGAAQYEILFSEEGSVLRKEELSNFPAFIEF